MPIQPKGTRRPFFVVTAPDANPIGYGLLARNLSADQPVLGLQPHYKRLTEGEYQETELDLLAAQSIEAMRKAQPEGPYLLGGMCEGATIAFTMARQLSEQGSEVALLAIFDTWVTENTYSRFWFHFDYYVRRIGPVLKLGPRQVLRIVRRKINNLRRHVINPLRYTYWPSGDFVPRVYGGRVTLFRTHKQPYTRIRDPQLGWGGKASGGVEVHVVPGTHQTLLREPHVKVLAQQLSDCIRRAH